MTKPQSGCLRSILRISILQQLSHLTMTTISPRTFQTITLTSPATTIISQSNQTPPNPTSPGSSLQFDLTHQSYRSHRQILQSDSSPFPHRLHPYLHPFDLSCSQKQSDKTFQLPALDRSGSIVRRSVKSQAAALNEHPEQTSLMYVHLRGPSTGPPRKSTYAKPIGELARTRAERRKSGSFLSLGLLPSARFPRFQVSTRYDSIDIRGLYAVVTY